MQLRAKLIIALSLVIRVVMAIAVVVLLRDATVATDRIAMAVVFLVLLSLPTVRRSSVPLAGRASTVAVGRMLRWVAPCAIIGWMLMPAMPLVLVFAGLGMKAVGDRLPRISEDSAARLTDGQHLT